MTRRLTLILTLLPVPAFAHVGDHSELTMARALAHGASQPDHALSLVALAALACVGAVLWRRVAQKVRK